MRRILAVLVIVFLASGLAWAGTTGTIPAAQQPIVKEVNGAGKISLEAAKYPKFENMQPESVTIGGVVYETDPGCRSPFTVFTTLALKPITSVSPTTGKGVAVTYGGSLLDKTKLGSQPTDLKLTLTSKEIPESYRTSAKIMVTWTVRIEGECPNWTIGHYICEPWNGQITFVCPKGDVKTYLNAKYTVNGQATSGVIGHPVTLEMPSGTTGPVMQRDPTLTGTYVITADDFPDKKIPQDLELQIYWENFTALRINSPDGLRNMIVNVLPYTKKN